MVKGKDQSIGLLYIYIYIYIDYFTPFVLLDILFLFLVNLYLNQQDFTFYHIPAVVHKTPK